MIIRKSSVSYLVRICVFAIVILTCSVSMSFASEQIESTATPEDKKTLSELWTNIKSLEEERSSLDNKWDFFRKLHGSVEEMIREDLLEEESDELEQILYVYNSKRKGLEILLVESLRQSQDTTQVKQDLIELKRWFYKDIAEYIDPKKIGDFLKYIKWDIELNEKNKEIKEELYKETVEFNQKVSSLKEKIEDHKEDIQETTQKLISEKLTEKLSQVKQNPKYLELSLDKKISFFEKALQKTKTRKQKLLDNTTQTWISQKKVELYTMVEEAIFEEIQILNLKK